MRRLFILRPQPGGDRSAQRARELGLESVLAPLFRIAPVAWQVPEPAAFDALLLTSANAVRCAGDDVERLRGLAVHAVGEATAEAARDAGFAIASTGESGVDRLLGSLDPQVKLLHLCGEDRRVPAGAPQQITPLVVYRAEPLPADLAGLNGAVAAVHSPRAAARLADLVGEDVRPGVRIAAISDAAASAAGGGWERLEAAEAPNDDALLALAARLCEKNRG